MKPITKKDNNELLTRKEFRAFTQDVDKRFSQVDQRFDKVDQRFDKVDQRFDKVDQRFDKLELALHNQAKAIVRNTEDIAIMKETMSTKDDIKKVLSAIDSFVHNSQAVERTSIVNTHRIMELETKYSDLDKRLSTVETTLHK